MPGSRHRLPCQTFFGKPSSMAEGAEMWATLLADWKKRFGFDRIVYVDIANETPYFFPGLLAQLKKTTGAGFDEYPVFSAEQISFLANEINKALGSCGGIPGVALHHVDSRRLALARCADGTRLPRCAFLRRCRPRWTERTRFNEFVEDGIFEKDRWFKEFSERSTKTAASIAPCCAHVKDSRCRSSQIGRRAVGRLSQRRRLGRLGITSMTRDWTGPGCWIGRSGRVMTQSLASSGAGLRIIMLNRSLQTGRTCNGIARSTNAF